MEPIAKRLKQSAEAALSGVANSKKPPQDDIAEQIKRLEAELHGSGSSSDDDDDSSDEEASSSFSSDNDESHETTLKKKNKSKTKTATVLSLSVYADERVESLPEHLLPKASATAANLTDKKKRKSRDDDKAAANASLMDAIQWPKRVPFACKPCGFVGKDLEEFQAHKLSENHLARQQNVGGVLTCKLCDKSFTSPQQLEDHKAGKWHLQRTQQRKARHVVKVCYNFMRGHCKWGDRCTFEHTQTKAMKTGRVFDRTKKNACDAFQRRGECKYGDQCLFAHVPAEA